MNGGRDAQRRPNLTLNAQKGARGSLVKVAKVSKEASGGEEEDKKTLFAHLHQRVKRGNV